MPPPNVTAVLHIGHGLNNTVQDVLIRWARMRATRRSGCPAPTTPASRRRTSSRSSLAKEGKTRYDLGRDAFVRRTEQFVAETGGAILQQLRAIGASADWSRTAYTLSPELSRAVREAFVRLYERGLIYRGHRVIHWCPRCLTSLSDEEAEQRRDGASSTTSPYPLTAVSREPMAIVVATTRPETMLGDVAVAVNPNDERYQDLIGKHGAAADRRHRRSRSSPTSTPIRSSARAS